MTDSPQQMIVEGLSSAGEYLPKLIDGLVKVLELIREGQEVEATNLFLEASEGLEWYTSLLSGIKALYPVMLRKELQGKIVEDGLNETHAKYMELIQALNSGDIVLFGDLLGYEVIPWLRYWSQVTPEMIQFVKAH